MPLLHALTATPLPQTFPFRSAALRFRQDSGRLEYGLVIEVPLKDVAFAEDKANHRFRAQLSLLALFKDERGEIVERFSRDLPLSADPEFQPGPVRTAHYRETGSVDRRRAHHLFGSSLDPGAMQNRFSRRKL